MVEFDANTLWKSLPDLDSRTLQFNHAVIRNVKVGSVNHAVVRNVKVGSQYLVSGALERAASTVGADPEGARAFELVTGTPFSLRIARERLLIVSEDEAALACGWHEDGYAVTEMSGAFAVFEISGRGAIDVVKRGTTSSPGEPGLSAAINFAGMTTYLYRFRSHDVIRLHVDRTLAPYLWEWFETLHDVAAL